MYLGLSLFLKCQLFPVAVKVCRISVITLTVCLHWYELVYKVLNSSCSCNNVYIDDITVAGGNCCYITVVATRAMNFVLLCTVTRCNIVEV